MTDSGILAARRLRRVRTDRLDVIVIDVDPTEDERALAVMQASLHPRVDGGRIVYGYDIGIGGLGQWIGDRTLRLRVWPAVVDVDGIITEDDHEKPGADVLTVLVDPVEHRAMLDELRQLGRLAIAGPESGPVPLLLDLDTDLLGSVLDDLSS